MTGAADPLAGVLSGARSPGLYRSASPVDPEAAALAGWRVAVLDGRAITSAAELLDACARALEFPAWYGRNWDALVDCLSDLSWVPAPGYLLLWRHAEVLAGTAPDAFATACRVFAAASGKRRAFAAPALVTVLVGVDRPDVPAL